QIYEASLCHELCLRNLRFERQKPVPIFYKGVKLGVPLYLDLIVEEKVIVDLKAKEEVTRLDRAKLLSYLRLSHLRLGLKATFTRCTSKMAYSAWLTAFNLQNQAHSLFSPLLDSNMKFPNAEVQRFVASYYVRLFAPLCVSALNTLLPNSSQGQFTERLN